MTAVHITSVEVSQIVVLDVETTGKDRGTDQIIEVCLRFGLNADAKSRVWRIRPEIPIHYEAVLVHGITMEDVAACPLFATVAQEFLPFLQEAEVLVGYNVAFDLDMLQAEMARASMPPFNCTGKAIVDVLRLWHHVEPRTLVAAHAKFCGEAFSNAHQATADVAATARVLCSMLKVFKLEDKSWEALAEIATPFADRGAWLGPSFHIQRDKSGAVVFGFGKWKGRQVTHADDGFLRWMLAKNFPPHVKKICQAVLSNRRSFVEWVSAHYPWPRTESLEEDSFENASSVQGELL